MATITTLIPAYKKDYLGETFLGLRCAAGGAADPG